MAEKKGIVKGKGERERYTHLDECQIPENIMESLKKKNLLKWTMKRNRGT